MGAVQSCLPFLKSKVPQAEALELVASGAAELKKVVLNEVEKAEKVVLNEVEKVVEGLKLNVPDELAAMIPQVAIDDAVKKALETVVEKVTEEVVATVDKGAKEIVTVVENAKDLAAQVSEMEKVD
jgi:hypothetical protein